MTNIVTKCHIKALSENVELGFIGGVAASGVDTLWVVMDMLANGISCHYIIIFIGLLLSTSVLSIALVKHHKSNVKQQIGLLFIFKKDICKAKCRKARREKTK